VTDRSHALVFGTLLGMTYPPEEGAQRVLVATLYDGTDTLELRWPGRSSIPGLSVGQRLEVEGTVGRVGERLVIINPLYRVIAGEG
jgi:nucleic acid binding, OB-fold, tRNA/helicase-type